MWQVSWYYILSFWSGADRRCRDPDGSTDTSDGDHQEGGWRSSFSSHGGKVNNILPHELRFLTFTLTFFPLLAVLTCFQAIVNVVVIVAFKHLSLLLLVVQTAAGPSGGGSYRRGDGQEGSGGGGPPAGGGAFS